MLNLLVNVHLTADFSVVGSTDATNLGAPLAYILEEHSQSWSYNVSMLSNSLHKQ